MNMEKYLSFKNTIPEIPGIMGRHKYKTFVIFVPFIYIDEQYHFLFQERAPNIRQGGEICFPGGAFDSKTDNDYKDTAIRETIEELGIQKEKIIVEGRLDSVVTPSEFIIDIFIGRIEVNNLDEFNINKDEVERIIVIPVSHFMNNDPEEFNIVLEIQPSMPDVKDMENFLLLIEELGLSKMYKKPWPARSHKVYAYRTSECVVWGLTAEIINEMKRLFLSNA